MKILSIETSCDETSVAIIEATGGLEKPNFTVLSHLILSQVKIHEKYGGVFPNLAKREHSKNLGPLLKKALDEAGLWVAKDNKIPEDQVKKIKTDLSREPELFTNLLNIFETGVAPQIDLIAVTNGPGLEPALWVGINAAKTLSEMWSVPVMPVNHMEGHISSVLSNLNGPVQFPALALLISGGHTELVIISDWLTHTIIGETRDDAVGEVFDKVARMLGLPYPGGPQISALAEEARSEEIRAGSEKTAKNQTPSGKATEKATEKVLEKTTEKIPKQKFNFPRPMIKSPDYDFSFSGLKTSVLYAIRDLLVIRPILDISTKKSIALEFENAIIDTLLAKTKRAIDEFTPKTLIIAGGVISNKAIRGAFDNLTKENGGIVFLVPTQGLSTDNALMIAMAAYIRQQKSPTSISADRDFSAEGNLRLS